MSLTNIGPYRIERHLASGGMAEVFVARRVGPHGFQKRLALKRILPQHARAPEFVGMFIDEARLAARLEHPGIVQVFDFGEQDGSLFMAMELVKGTTVGRLLRSVASRATSVPLGPALHIAHEAARALSYAHSLHDDNGDPLHIVHRDVSPANLLLTRQGHVKLADFGIARARTTAARTEAGHVRGKLGYMSPEQVVGDPIDGKSDIFTLGVLLAELLLGEPLFPPAGELDTLIQIRNADLSRLEERGAQLPKDVLGVVRWALERRPSDRPHAHQLEDTLREILLRRGEIGRGPRSLARLLERMELVPRTLSEVDLAEPGRRPTFLVDFDEKNPAPQGARELLAQMPVDPPAGYELRRPDGVVEGPVPYAEVVRRIVTGQMVPGTRVRKDQGTFENAYSVPELQRYLESNVLHCQPSGLPPKAERRGVIYGGRLLREAHQLTARRQTGVLHLWNGTRQKRIYYVDGRPDYVASNNMSELFGEFLVAQGTILRMELEMALAMLDRYDGRLGDALVGLGILRPMELFNAVSRQVKARYLEAFRWDRGQWAYVPEERADQETFPLAHREHELLRDAAMGVSASQLEAALRPVKTRALRRNPHPSAPLNAYRVPQEWERVIGELDGTTTMLSVLAREYARGGLDTGEVQRALYLGLSCDLVEAA